MLLCLPSTMPYVLSPFEGEEFGALTTLCDSPIRKEGPLLLPASDEYVLSPFEGEG